MNIQGLALGLAEQKNKALISEAKDLQVNFAQLFDEKNLRPDASKKGFAPEPELKISGMAVETKKMSEREDAEFESEAATEFLDIMGMPVGERMFYLWLAAHGMNKEDYEAMTD